MAHIVGVSIVGLFHPKLRGQPESADAERSTR
jgi:hypothetical protein